MISNVTNVIRVRFYPTVTIVFILAIFVYFYSCNRSICFLKNTSLGKKLSQLRRGSYHPDKDEAWIPINETAPRTSSKTLNILCFGDSITEGHVTISGYFIDTHPYTIKLNKLLVKLGEKNGVKYNVINRGLSGEHVHGQMIDRLSHLLTPNSVKCDWVVILGGTNDIRRGMWFEVYDDDLVYNDLVKLHTYCHMKGIKTIAVTIPARQCELKQVCTKVKTMRLKINRKLKKFVNETGQGKVILADLAEKLPFHALSIEEREKYWFDEMHFTHEGYDKIGDIIYEAFQEHLLL